MTFQGGTSAQTPEGQGDRVVQTQRLEGEAILGLADAALAGKPVPADFDIRWHNEFLKAQRGTFVPFTLTVDLSRISAPAALVYVRAVRRSAPATEERKRDRKSASTAVQEFAVDAIFPVELKPEPGQIARIHRGFSLTPGQYDVFVVLRERQHTSEPSARPRATVLKHLLSVPDFWSGGLTTSSVVIADRLTEIEGPIGADALAERPYVIGQNDITPAADRMFRRDEELIFVFLVYNPTVTAEKKFDLQVEYHFFRKLAPGSQRGAGTKDAAATIAAPHPPEQEGERYFNHTEPQRFNPSMPGAPVDPASGQPVVAGQGVPLAGFESGDYRLAIKVTDLLSGKSILRDVFFTVGS